MKNLPPIIQPDAHRTGLHIPLGQMWTRGMLTKQFGKQVFPHLAGDDGSRGAFAHDHGQNVYLYDRRGQCFRVVSGAIVLYQARQTIRLINQERRHRITRWLAGSTTPPSRR